MILTLGWKEYREHWPIWLTMVLMTGLLVFGMAQFASTSDDVASRVALAALGMVATYGVVCGAMMFAGEREAGTMVFLDVFHGQRGLLWGSKLLIGLVFAVLQGLAVALVLYLLKQTPARWVPALIGRDSGNMFRIGLEVAAPREFWFVLLPVVAVEAYAWGLFGSALTWRVLTGAALAAAMAAPFLLTLIFTPPPIYLGVRLVLAGGALLASFGIFLNQSREPRTGPPPRRREELPPLPRMAREWERHKFELERRAPALVPAAAPAWDIPVAEAVEARVAKVVRRPKRPADAGSPSEALGWLAFRQGGMLFGIFAGAGLVVGFFLPYFGQALWPIATLLLGVACGAAAFAPEQRDQSYQFLSAAHLPLRTFWSIKLLFWLLVAVGSTLLAIVGAGLTVVFANLGAPPGGWRESAVAFDFGSLPGIMGAVLYFSVWLVYGFCAGQVLVLFFRKNILALLISGLVAVGAIGLWMPSLLAGGMSGWQVWLPPLIALAATWRLVRPWTAGRIRDRKPLAAASAFAAVILLWVAGTFTLRMWQLPDVGAPLDREAYKASLLPADGNVAGQKIREALAGAEGAENPQAWLLALAEAARLPPGVVETPPRDGRSPNPPHLQDARKIAGRLRVLAKSAQARGDSTRAFELLGQTLALSRNLRNKAPLESYLTGIEIEESALKGLEAWLAREKPAPQLLRRALGELNRHAAQTPTPLDCLQTECFRAGGLIENPTGWTFYSGGGFDHVPERWLASAVALSLDMPWEQQRATRLWRAVWAGLFRGIDTPFWQHPETPPELVTKKESTRRILAGWLPASDGPEASLTATQLAAALDASWLSDEHLFSPVEKLSAAATRARWRVDSGRLVFALALHQLEGKPAQKLDDLVPKYLAELPADPYSGSPFRYRISQGERVVLLGDEDVIDRKGRDHEDVQPGRGIVWSTGPDRTDHGGRRHGGPLKDDAREWAQGEYDLIQLVPHWR